MGNNQQKFLTKEIRQFIKTSDGKWDKYYSDSPLYKMILKYYPESQTSCFIEDYLSNGKYGAIKYMAKRYYMSDCTVQRIRRQLGLPLVFETDARKQLVKRIKRLYYQGNSSLHISQVKTIKLCPEQIRHILQKERVTLRPAHVTDARLFKTQQTKFTPTLLLKEIKRLYVDEHMPCKQIADRLGIWEGTVSSKLKAMGIEIHFRRRQLNIQCHANFNIRDVYNGGDPFFISFGKHVQFEMPVTKTGVKGNCVWCGAEFLKYISKGIKEQIFCCHRCKNRAKDLRRILKPRWIKGKYVTDFSARLKVLSLEIKGDIERLGLTDDVKQKVYALRAEVSSPLNKSHDKNQRREK